MDEQQFRKLLDELTDIRNLLILNASKAGATSGEIGKVLGIVDSRVRQILNGTDGKKKKESSKTKKSA
jgi:hypothetical protein